MGRLLRALLVAALTAGNAALAAETRDPYLHFFHPLTGDLRAELADARSAGKKAVFIMFEQEGCPACLYMKSHVLGRSDVQKAYRARFLNFAVDIHGAVPLGDFAGRARTEKDYARSAGVKVTPTLVFYDLTGAEILRIAGPVRDPAEFLLLGEFVASGAYRSRSFSEYRQARPKDSGS